MAEEKEEINAGVDEKKITNKDNSEEKSAENDKKFSMNDKKNQFVEKARNNPWMVASVVLGVLLLGFLFSGSGVTGGVITGGAVSEGEIVSSKVAGEKLLDFAESRDMDIEILEINEKDGFYEVSFSSDEGDSKVLLTMDGKNIASLIPLSISDSAPREIKSDFSDEDNLKIQEFSKCVAGKGFRVYAADWCPHCENMKDSFGGHDNVEAFWITCSDASRKPTENAGLCEEEEITGFPSMKLNGEFLNIPRTFEAIAEATGCPAPQLE